MTVLNANRVDPSQTPRSAAPDLGLYCIWVYTACKCLPLRVLYINGLNELGSSIFYDRMCAKQ